MMCLSQTAGYAIHALSVVARGEGRHWLIREIARASGVPGAYLAKIINQLSRRGLVAAKRGVQGGIYLSRPPETITLLEVVEAIEGKQFMADCLLSMDNCDDPRVCPAHKVWERVREEIRAALRQITLAQVAKKPPLARLAGKKGLRGKSKSLKMLSSRKNSMKSKIAGNGRVLH